MGLPAVIAGLIPVVETSFTSPKGGATTGTVAPGVFYEADTWQVGVEAVIPANAATRLSQGTGVIAQMHLYLDDIFPQSLGRPFI